MYKFLTCLCQYVVDPPLAPVVISVPITLSVKSVHRSTDKHTTQGATQIFCLSRFQLSGKVLV